MQISPIFYMGNKKKLIKKGLTDLFPTEIDTFVDVFGGSGVVSMNTNANSYRLNDINKHVVELYNLFKNNDCGYIIDEIEKRIKEYGLPLVRTKRYAFDDVEAIERYKKGFNDLRESYNQNRDIFDFYTLMFFSFSQQFRFNKNDNFNMPFGNDCFTDKNKDYIINGVNFFKKVTITNNDFKDFDFSTITKGDFVYFDPPYLDTTAVYNENNGWTHNHEKEFYKTVLALKKRGIFFGISNVAFNKGKENTMLMEFARSNDLNVHYFDDFVYHACGKGNAKTVEVYISNYKHDVIEENILF